MQAPGEDHFGAVLFQELEAQSFFGTGLFPETVCVDLRNCGLQGAYKAFDLEGLVLCFQQ